MPSITRLWPFSHTTQSCLAAMESAVVDQAAHAAAAATDAECMLREVRAALLLRVDAAASVETTANAILATVNDYN
ncbi:hypothetical protein Tco_1147180 [Tanacetum coccineum]